MRQLVISKNFTCRDSISLELYFNEIKRIRLLEVDDEALLAQRTKEGDRKAFEILVTANLRFVVSVAKQYQNRGLTLSDLINEGNIGLIKAAERFDDSRGLRFISYAVWWIRQSILLGISESARIVRIPLNRSNPITKVSNAFAKLEQEYNREPMPEEIAELLHFQVKVVEDTLNISDFPVSFDAPIFEESDSTMVDIFVNKDAVSPDRDLVNGSLKIEIDRLLAKLPDLDKTILRYYFGLQSEMALSLEEIGIKTGYTRERVRQLKEKAIKKLKDKQKCSLLRSFLG